MRKYIFILFIAFSNMISYGQENLQQALDKISENNLSLQTFKNEAQAQHWQQRTELNPVDPEVEFLYQWGSPKEIGNRIEFSVKQQFDFPSVYFLRSQIAKMENSNTETNYRLNRINVLVEARACLIDMIYYNALIGELNKQMQNIERLNRAYQNEYQKGNIVGLEMTKVQNRLVSLRNQLINIEMERNETASKLNLLNGGMALDFNVDRYSEVIIPSDFNRWYETIQEQSPLLLMLQQQMDASKKRVALNKALGLPKLSVGYSAERVGGTESFNGITAGISLPLWENRNKVKQAKAEFAADESRSAEVRTQYREKLNALYLRSLSLQKITQQYQQGTNLENQERMLITAYKTGELSLSEYLLEWEIYFETYKQKWQAERELRQAWNELTATQL